MSILSRKGKPMMLTNVEITSIGDEKKLVVMNLTSVDRRRMTVALLPETAVVMLEELSTTTLGVNKR